VTTPVYSRFMMQSLALVHVQPKFAARGTEVEARGPKMNCKAYVWQPPFYGAAAVATGKLVLGLESQRVRRHALARPYLSDVHDPKESQTIGVFC